MNWNSVLTDSGVALLAQSVAEETAAIVCAAKGGSTSVANPVAATTVTAPQKVLSISSKTAIDNGIKIAVQISNANVTEGFTLKQIGLFAKIGADGDETLLALAQNTDGEYIPSTTEQPEYLFEVVFLINYASTEEITVEVNPSAFATQADIAALQAQILQAAEMTDTVTGEKSHFEMRNGVLKVITETEQEG